MKYKLFVCFLVVVIFSFLIFFFCLDSYKEKKINIKLGPILNNPFISFNGKTYYDSFRHKTKLIARIEPVDDFKIVKKKEGDRLVIELQRDFSPGILSNKSIEVEAYGEYNEIYVTYK